VAAGFKVLQTTKNITFLLAAIQILTTVSLGLILITLLALIITVNPDLEHERQVLVTPVMRWLADSVMQYWRWVQVSLWTVIIGAVLGAVGGWYVTREVVESVEFEVEGPEGETEVGDDAGS
jgi:ABC-type xylose transport system permease subunit